MRHYLIILFIGFGLPSIFGQTSNFYYFRTISGIYNDLTNPTEGSAPSPLLRQQMEASYASGDSLIERANARMISNRLCHQEVSIPNSYMLSTMVYNFLQFIDHDIVATQGGGDEANILVPTGDAYFDPDSTGVAVIPFRRTVHIDSISPRTHLNHITAWIDGSVVYGSDDERARWLRSGICGKLKVSASPFGDLLPCNTITGHCGDSLDLDAPEMDHDTDMSGNPREVFVAGDIRANEQPGLTALHTLFVREHNRICDELIASGQCFDEKNYQFARKRVSALIQSILYNELLPILGIDIVSDTYESSLSPDVFNTFATAAYRLGHSMVTDNLMIHDTECGQPLDTLSLSEVFFHPSYIQANGISGLLSGMKRQRQQEIDTRVVSSIRNFLFGQPGAGGLDLAAVNIQRGRDHGVPDFNTVREIFGMDVYENIAQISSDLSVATALTETYLDIDNIDAWIGMVAEDHAPGSPFGPTIKNILTTQFSNMKHADRFFYTRDYLLTNSEKEEISKTRLADVIKRNTDIQVFTNAFKASDCLEQEELVYCNSYGESTSFEWIDIVKINGIDNISGNNHGYGNFTDIVFEAMNGGPLDIFLSPGYGGPAYRERWSIWIDLNADGEFDETEMMYQTNQRRNVVATITLPTGLPIGNRRMRIAMTYFNEIDPCGVIQYGEVEDYTIYIGTQSSSASVRSLVSEIQNPHAVGIKLYPNPVKNFTTVSFNASEEASVTFSLFDVTGRRIEEFHHVCQLGQNEIILDLSGLPNGLYRLTTSLNGEKSQPINLIKID